MLVYYLIFVNEEPILEEKKLTYEMPCSLQTPNFFNLIKLDHDIINDKENIALLSLYLYLKEV